MENRDFLSSGEYNSFVLAEREVDPRVAVSRKLAVFFGLTSLLLVGVTLTGVVGHKSDTNNLLNNLTNSLTTSTAQDSTDPPVTTADTSWVPSGYNIWANNSNVAWKWEDTTNSSCNVDATGGCYKAMFISQTGCPSGFYAAINLLDAAASEDGNVIGYQNASLPALGAMESASLEFDDTDGNSKSAHMSEISCG